MNILGTIATSVAIGGSYSAAGAGPATYQSSTATTEMIVAVCRQNPSGLKADFCSGYILGVYDRMAATGGICPPPGSSTEQAVAVVVKSLDEHPEHWSRQPSVLIAQALRKAFPCR